MAQLLGISRVNLTRTETGKRKLPTRAFEPLAKIIKKIDRVERKDFYTPIPCACNQEHKKHFESKLIETKFQIKERQRQLSGMERTYKQNQVLGNVLEQMKSDECDKDLLKVMKNGMFRKLSKCSSDARKILADEIALLEMNERFYSTILGKPARPMKHF